MSASSVIAASATAASGTVAVATSTGLTPALIGFVGTIVGAAIAQGAALMISHKGRIDAQQRDAAAKQHALRTLVAEERVLAHQGAFKRIKGLLAAGRNTKAIDDIDSWMDDNCLFLSAEARKAVWAAIGNAKARAQNLAESDNEGLEPAHRNLYSDQAMKNYGAIMDALTPVVDGVGLPPLGTDELKSIAESAGDRVLPASAKLGT
ncbi:hypothetical protein PQQ51_34115 [Paraburkholderia xenovorans]|uniref:hypothetical protein n=1 Tax=Paraburkholderia xenovorans TaxID=36873 RepID=UPI0038B78DA0